VSAKPVPIFIYVDLTSRCINACLFSSQPPWSRVVAIAMPTRRVPTQARVLCAFATRATPASGRIAQMKTSAQTPRLRRVPAQTRCAATLPEVSRACANRASHETPTTRVSVSMMKTFCGVVFISIVCLTINHWKIRFEAWWCRPSVHCRVCN